MKFVTLSCLSHYDVCHLMTFVTLWRLSHYDVCHIMTFVVYDVCRIMMFVALWRQLWRLSLIGFVAVSYSLLWIVLYIVVYGEYGCGGCGCSIESFILYKLCGAEIIYFRLRLLFQHSGLCRLCFFIFRRFFSISAAGVKEFEFICRVQVVRDKVAFGFMSQSASWCSG